MTAWPHSFWKHLERYLLVAVGALVLGVNASVQQVLAEFILIHEVTTLAMLMWTQKHVPIRTLFLPVFYKLFVCVNFSFWRIFFTKLVLLVHIKTIKFNCHFIKTINILLKNRMCGALAGERRLTLYRWTCNGGSEESDWVNEGFFSITHIMPTVIFFLVIIFASCLISPWKWTL